MIYDKIGREIYEWNKEVGWWDGEQCLYQKAQLVSTEVAEATEGERKNLPDDHLPNRPMGEVELADAMIRILDLGARLDMHVRKVEPHRWCLADDHGNVGTIGKQHLGINAALVIFMIRFDASEFTKQSEDFLLMEKAYSQIVFSIEQVAFNQGYDLNGSVLAKMTYNRNRLDHTREYRHGDHFDSKSF